jgi:hypothetical protein
MTHFRTLALTCSLMILAAVLVQPAYTQGHGSIPMTEQVRFPQGRDAVSFPFENWGEHLIIPVSVNGLPPLQMVFDTGMPIPGVLLYEGALVDSMKLAFGPMQVNVGGAGGGGSMKARLAPGVTLGLGALSVSGSVAIVMPQTPLSSLHDGIIGASLFNGLVVSVNHDQNVMTLTNREAFTPPKGATEVPLEVVGRHAYVKAGVVGADGKLTSVRLILDLGATHSVSLNLRANPAIRLPAGAFATRIGRGMSGVMTGSVGRIAGFELGGHRLTGVVATFPDSEFESPRGLDSGDGNLGGGILGRFNVTLDYGGKRMYLVPNHRFADAFDWDMTGVSFEIGDHGDIEVKAVLPGSPAASAGVKTGEALIAVDGVKAVPRDLLREHERFRKEGREVVLTLRSDGHDRQVKLKLRRLV